MSKIELICTITKNLYEYIYKSIYFYKKIWNFKSFDIKKYNILFVYYSTYVIKKVFFFVINLFILYYILIKIIKYA